MNMTTLDCFNTCTSVTARRRMVERLIEDRTKDFKACFHAEDAVKKDGY